MTSPGLSGLVETLRAGLRDRYAIEREIGIGGMAAVFLAHDLQRDRRVALKVLRPDLGGLVAAERFHREIRLVAQLVHPHILPLLDSGETAGRLWFTTPFIEGESLRARLDRERQLPLDDAIRLTSQVADALTHAHGKGILHRDIKPENILLADGHALVADFGIARALAGEPDDRLTETGLAVGTPGYMSPEQSTGERQLDVRTDLYSLASVCYEMLAGEPPFTGPTAQIVIARRLSQPAPSLRTARPGIPEAVDAAVQRGLATSPADRYPTTADFSQALLGAAATTSSRTPWTRLAVAGVALCLVAGAGFLALRPRPSVEAVRSGAIRLAVVPFRLLGRDSADQYLADGISEEVNATLSNLSGLRVIAQSSVATVAASGKRVKDIGTALDADALVEGQVERAGDSIRVRVMLVDPRTEETRWSQRYDHTSKDVFGVQSEVAAKVAGLLRIQLAARESRSLGRLPTTNPDAYDLYLRARSQGGYANPSRSGLDSAIVSLSKAVQLDSNFAAARAFRASMLSNLVFLFDAPQERLDQAQTDITAALAIDSTLAEAWEARSTLVWNAVRGWNFGEALVDAQRALMYRPSLVDAHNDLGSLYFHYGFHDAAKQELDLSLSLDPLDSCGSRARCTGFTRPRLARVHWYQQQFDGALKIYAAMPYVGDFVWEYAVVLSDVGRPADGLAALDSSRAPGATESADREAARGLLYAALNRRGEALGQLKAAAGHSTSRSHFHHAQFTMACAYARLGMTTEAVAWLKQTAENGMPNYPLFRNDPNLRSLQGNAAYEALMTGLKLQFEANGKLVRASELASAPHP